MKPIIFRWYYFKKMSYKALHNLSLEAFLPKGIPRCFLPSAVLCLSQKSKSRRALNSPLSPHPVGLITTSYSVPRSLRKSSARFSNNKKNALAKKTAIFLNCVTDSRAAFRVCVDALKGTFFLDLCSSVGLN